ncbi:cytochrome P450 [Lentinus tigrinus ALCF2SS1-7]|uniref:Cytochrome P450 n=1 Tax=Lentinus tigrinus ALCF2SS1-6 TaxID=1328759 RepID=A0A5C2SFV7_9APHY|nr:cytochrome P450 [Lentinus tigrinus ALCF2SS1-6]RPD77565.1 cytochrome P450 [Lentinus tigrinus ALCF2SS1-7]
MEDQRTAVLCALLAVAFVAYIARWRSDPLRKIPTVGGPSAPILSYWSAFNFLRKPRALLSEGYERYYGSAFKVALFDQWHVVVSGPKMVDDVRKRPDDELSFTEGTEETIQLRFTLSSDMMEDPYHVDLIKDKLMRSLAGVLPDVIDELSVAVPEYIRSEDDESEWVKVNILHATQKIIARASNRIFVGLPACRNEAYLDLAIKFAIDVMKDMFFLGLAPPPMRPFLSRCFSAARRSIRGSVPHLKPLLDERRAKMEAYGDDYPEKPNDMLQWVLEEALPRGQGDYQIAERIMVMNFAAIHTSSNSISHALLHLAEEPKYIQPLRDEVEAVVAAEGWTKNAMGKMWKIDSFLKESQRVNGVALTSVTRKALKDTTLVDGTFIPKGTLIAAASYPTHFDDGIYENASVFDPFRFSRLRAAEGESTKHHLVHTSPEYMPFGHGKHACPGRFFAANELKAMLAYIVLNYDLKLPGDGRRPGNVYFANNVIPDPRAEILFKKRQNAT